MINAILASTSTVHGQGYLEYLKTDLKKHFINVNRILFIPYARPGGITMKEYTDKARSFFTTIQKDVIGINEYDLPENGLKEAEGIFIGGGNTFVLLKTLYDYKILNLLREKILNGTPYLGTSAGSNIFGQTIGTTNDMPVVYPPSFKALELIPFNINPHYLDPDPTSTHMGETRELRIKEFHHYNTTAVIGLREGSFLKINSNKITLGGKLTARLFRKDEDAVEIDSNFNFNQL